MSFGSSPFRVTHVDGAARRGVLRTAHGDIETPVFMPVGTRGAVKAVTHRDLEDLGAAIILGNTYHLHLRPGDELIARAGGLHRFIGWRGPILTDSGGYQVFSLAGDARVARTGVEFRSHLDGALCALTPESAADIQARLGSDIAMVLDECVGPHQPGSSTPEAAMERSVRWARRGRERFQQLRDPAVAGAVQVTNPGQASSGSSRAGPIAICATEASRPPCEIGFEAYAIGGLSVGEPVDLMYDVVGHTAPQLPPERRRATDGHRHARRLVECVARGIDMFDCVLPTRNARNGQLLTRHGAIAIKNAPLSRRTRARPTRRARAPPAGTVRRAYLRHLFMAGEMTAATLNTVHNLNFYLDLMRRIREAIVFGTFARTPPGVSTNASPDALSDNRIR